MLASGRLYLVILFQIYGVVTRDLWCSLVSCSARPSTIEIVLKRIEAGAWVRIHNTGYFCVTYEWVKKLECVSLTSINNIL